MKTIPKFRPVKFLSRRSPFLEVTILGSVVGEGWESGFAGRAPIMFGHSCKAKVGLLVSVKLMQV